MEGVRARGSILAVLLLSTAAVHSVAGRASAQAASASAPAPTEAELAEARRVFAVGIRHADRGEWEDAVVCFRQVLEVRQAPPVLFNLGAALVALNQYPEAEPLLRRVVDDPNAEASLVERARTAVATMAERGGRLTIHLTGGSPATVVTVDGLVLEHDQLETDIAMSAGDHEIVAREGADELARRSVHVAPGDHAEIALTLGSTAPLAQADVTHAATEAERASHTQIGTTGTRADRRRRLLHNPWFWTGVGAGVVLIGVTTFAIAWDRPVGSPVQGNATPGVIRF